MTKASPPDGWLSIGHLRRPHGLRGDMYVQLTTDRTDRLAPGATLFASGRTLEVVAARIAGNGRMIARFDAFADRTDAERVTNAELFAAPVDDPDALWVHEMIGLPVVDQLGVERGTCAAVLANPAADLLELDTGALVPSNFVTAIVDGRIEVDVPDGLFELHDD